MENFIDNELEAISSDDEADIASDDEKESDDEKNNDESNK